MKEKVKKFFHRPFIKNIVAPLVEGAIQSTPGGNGAAKIIGAVSHIIKGTYKQIPADKKPKWVAVGMEVLCVGLIIYAFLTNAIVIDDVLRLFGYEVPVTE